MRLVLFEGQPGSGKSTLSECIYNKFLDRNEKCVLIDEYKQDTEIFGDYWDSFDKSSEELMAKFIKSWEDFLNYMDDDGVVIVDNALLNQIQYIMAINADIDKIKEFFNKVINIFKSIEVQMVFIDGDSNTVIRRVNQVRKNGWGQRVAELLEKSPYQKLRNRKGIDGMVEFFSDSQSLKRRVLIDWPYPIIKIDATYENWNENRQIVSKLVF